MRALLELNADPNLVEKDGGGPLHEAVYYMERIRRKNQSTVSPPGGTPDTQATNSTEMMVLETEMTASSENSESVSHDSEVSARLEILHLLLDTGRCIVDLCESHGCTPLWYAAGGGWTEAVEALLDAGADPDPPHLAGKQGPASPLMHAIDRGHYETAATLLDRGAHLPSSFDVEAFTSSNIHIPAEFAETLRSGTVVFQQKARTPVIRDDIISIGKQCEPVPIEALPRPTETSNEEN